MGKVTTLQCVVSTCFFSLATYPYAKHAIFKALVLIDFHAAADMRWSDATSFIQIIGGCRR